MEEPEVEEEREDDGSEVGSIKDLTKAFRKRFRNNLDVTVCITGDEGLGKTTLGILLALDLDEDFDLPRNVLFDPDLQKLYGLVYKLPSESGIVVDETIRVAYKRRWQSANNIFLNELYTICRYRRQASFFCIPRFNQLDSDFQKRIWFWIHIPFRGWGIVFMKDGNPFSADPWNIKESYKLIQKTFSGSTVIGREIDDFVSACSNLPNYVGVIKFPDLPEELKKQYDSLKQPFEFKKQQETESARTLILRNALKNCIGELHKLGWVQRKIVVLTGLSDGIVNSYLKDLGLRASDVKAEKTVAPKFFLKEEEKIVSS